MYIYIYIIHTYIYLSIYRSIYPSIHLYPPLSTSIYLYLPLSTSIYLYLPLSTSIYLYLPLSTSIYLYLPLSTSIYLYLPLSTSIYLYLPLSTSIYLYLPLSTHLPIYPSTYQAIQRSSTHLAGQQVPGQTRGLLEAVSWSSGNAGGESLGLLSVWMVRKSCTILGWLKHYKLMGFHHQLAQDFTGPSTVSWNVLSPQGDLVDLPPSAVFFFHWENVKTNSGHGFCPKRRG